MHTGQMTRRRCPSRFTNAKDVRTPSKTEVRILEKDWMINRKQLHRTGFNPYFYCIISSGAAPTESSATERVPATDSTKTVPGRCHAVRTSVKGGVCVRCL